MLHFIEYIKYEKKYSPYTITAYKNDLETFQNFCKNEFDEKDLSILPYSIIRSWIVDLVESNISNRTINRKISSLKSYYTYLLKTKQISQNPLRKHQALKIQKKVNVPFSQKEVLEVLEN
ncbi:MAG: site-specific integrase, partial [Flavobacteriaceae bacterium]|nr:site-specific integrase [Flavobacteriaceae bacterium]